MGLIHELGRFPGGGHGNALQYSCLRNSMDRGAWWIAVHGVAKSQTWLKRLSMHTHTALALPKQQTHSAKWLQVSLLRYYVAFPLPHPEPLPWGWHHSVLSSGTWNLYFLTLWGYKDLRKFSLKVSGQLIPYPTLPGNAGKEAATAAAATKLLQSCLTLCHPIDSSPPGSPVPRILQARTLEWVAISFSSAWKWKVKVKSISCVRLSVTPGTAAYQAPLSMGFSRQEYWSGLPLPSPGKEATHFQNTGYLGSLYFLRYSVASEEVGVSPNFCASDMTGWGQFL